MARLKLTMKEMSRKFTCFFLVFQTICQICHSLETVESHNQAFIQTDKHLTYIVGDVSSGIPIEVKPGQVYNEIVGADDLIAIQLDPPMLDFQERPVGMPRREQVTVYNLDSKAILHLFSISGSTAHFHCSFFQDKIVPPGGNTTFDVVFLARQEGNVENTLYIHTSLGSFKYQTEEKEKQTSVEKPVDTILPLSTSYLCLPCQQKNQRTRVFGVGVPNPYRLRPYLGARVPVNSSFAPLINMHNPHSTTLQVLEMFSSEGDLHLELPNGDKEAPRTLWEIPPYETKTIMQAHFVGRTENNHTAFIRIKTNRKEDKRLLVLPMEVEVSSTPGIYVSNEMLDFGIVRTFDPPKTVPLSLINTGDTPIQISSVSLSPPNEAISVDFRPIKLQPELLRQTVVAHITFRASRAFQPKMWSGKIVIRSKNNVHKISIPYEARVLHGSLTYHKNMTYFFAHAAPSNYSRKMTFTNTFNFSLVLYNVTMPPEARHVFSILNFTKPVILQPQRMIDPFLLLFHPKTGHMHFKTKLILHTNASIFEIEIVVYNGQLKIIPHRPEKFEGQLDFGTMGVKENKSVLFTIVNDNPVELLLYEYSTDMKGAILELLGIEKGNGTMLSRIHNMSAVNTKPLIIWPYHFAVFSLNLVAPEEEGSYQAEVLISTPFQETFMPVLVRTSEGSLHAIPEKIVFDKVFPGKIPMKILQVHSTFHDYMELKSVTFQPPDPRFYFVMEKEDKNKLLVLEPQTNNTIGRIFYNSKKECREECYVGLPTHSPAGHQWVLGLHLERDVSDTDHYLYTHLLNRWKRLQEQGKDRLNVTIEIDTSTVQGFLFSAHVQHSWPDVIRKCRSRFMFPLTQIGNSSTIDLVIENPGDTPILVQVLPLHLYPNPQTIVDLIKHDLPPNFAEHMETDDEDIFVLSDIKILNPIPDSSVNVFRKHVDDMMGVKSHRETITTILNKNVRVKVEVGFQPKDDGWKSSIIIVRNNLTIIDAVMVEGQGGRGEMKLNNKRPGASTLQFDIAQDHLKNCDKRKHSKNMVPNFTVKRSFTLKNTGKLPFYVHGYSINNSPCEGYGFRVLECEGYEMLPNTSKKFYIAFTPDFTMSRIQRILTIYTSLGAPFNYTLQATVPPHTLAKCSASLPRPNWEPVLYYSIVCVMGFLLFCILVASYFEADRIFVADILKRKVKSCNGMPTYQKEKIFDLKNIGVNSTTVTPPSSKPMVSPTITRLPPSLTRPVSELSNGHIEHKSREPFTTTLINIFKSFFIRKATNGKKKVENNNIESPTPVTSKSATTRTPDMLDTSQAPLYKITQIDRDRVTAAHDYVIPEKSNASHLQHKAMLRKTKAAKRSHTDTVTANSSTDNTAVSSLSATYDRKQGNKHGDKSPTDSTNSVKDRTNNYPTQTMTNSDSSGLAMFPDVKLSDIGKQKGKKKLRSKPERDNLIKDRLILRQMDDKDETSSTTTESSTGDIEEKNSSATESPCEPHVADTRTPDPPVQPKTKKSRSKSRNLEPLTIPSPMDDDPNGDDFELTSKSRAYKKIKGQKDLYGGEILKASSLDIELPYSMDNKTKTKKKKVSPSPPLKEPEKPLTKDKPRGAAAVCDLDPIEDITMETQQSESDSPPPSWDEPLPNSPSDDFSELSIQTDKFAQKQAKSLESGSAHLTSISPDGLTSSSRSSSYSSIVSNSSGEGANGKNKGDKQRYPAGFTPFSDTNISGPLTPQTPPVTSASKTRNAWGSNSTPTTPDTVAGFGLQTIQEASRPGNTLTDAQADMFTEPNFPFNTSVASTADANYGFTPGYGQDSMTMMQKLQRERRRRLQEHKMRVLKAGDDWPGFDVPLTRSESLWDSEYNPLDANNAWAMSAEGAPPTSSTGLWSTLTSSANNSWNSLMGIWGGGDNAQTSISDPNTPENNSFTSTEGGNSANNSGTQSSESLPTFNPFSSDIWSPSVSSAGAGWSSLPTAPPNNQQEENKN